MAQYNITTAEEYPFLLRSVKLNDAAPGGPLQRNWIKGLALSADDKSLYIGCGETGLEEWDVSGMTLKRTLAEGETVTGDTIPLELTGGAQDRLLVSGFGGLVEVDVGTGAVAVRYDLAQAGINYLGRYTPAAASPDGTAVFVVSDSPSVLAEFSRATQKLVKTHYTGTKPLYMVAVSPDGRHVVFGGESGTLNLLATGSGQVTTLATCSTGALLSTAFARDSAAVFFGCEDSGTVRKVGLDGGLLWSGEQDGVTVRSMAVSADGLYLIATAGEKVGMWVPAYQWDTATGTLVRKFEAYAGKYLRLALSADGRRFYDGSSITKLYEWQMYPYGDECPLRLECQSNLCTVYTQCNNAGQDCTDPNPESGGNWECVCRAPAVGENSVGGPAQCAAPGAPTTTQQPTTSQPNVATPVPTPVPTPMPTTTPLPSVVTLEPTPVPTPMPTPLPLGATLEPTPVPTLVPTPLPLGATLEPTPVPTPMPTPTVMRSPTPRGGAVDDDDDSFPLWVVLVSVLVVVGVVGVAVAVYCLRPDGSTSFKHMNDVMMADNEMSDPHFRQHPTVTRL
eukprot:TRINITY_DN2757_c0_g1_i1.p1 TRINITY_DN2757_c0_g1~~TRINITY_DN2757_c0_g1_i1.p1  ORF type:complete len:624 (+),score=97.50 TRINITY_DN2757_c0_g1_i1:183-1874(+)